MATVEIHVTIEVEDAEHWAWVKERILPRLEAATVDVEGLPEEWKQ